MKKKSIGESGVVVGPLGFVPTPVGLRTSNKYRFFAATLPFFSLEFPASSQLWQENRNERKNTHLSRMRQSQRLEIRYNKHGTDKLRLQELFMLLLRALGTTQRRAQMSNVRQSKALERWQQVHNLRRENSTLAMQGLRIPLFRKQSETSIIPISFFFFKEEFN
jgi:hypothetical protein